MNLKKFDKFVKAMVDGVTPENFPILLMDVYMEVMKTKGLQKKEIEQRCIDILRYIVDNTDAGKYDDEIDATMHAMIPSMVSAFMNIERPSKFCCF